MKDTIQLAPDSSMLDTMTSDTIRCLEGTVVIGIDSTEAIMEGFRQACYTELTPHELAQFLYETGGIVPYQFYYINGSDLAAWLQGHRLHHPTAPIDVYPSVATPVPTSVSTPASIEYTATVGTTPVPVDSYPYTTPTETGISPILIIAAIALLLMAFSSKIEKMNIHSGEASTEQQVKSGKQEEFHDALDDVQEVIDELRRSNIKKRRRKRSKR